MGKLNTIKNGKGDTPRPVNRDNYDFNWAEIKWNSKKKQNKFR